jgi:hypothetical protein
MHQVAVKEARPKASATLVTMEERGSCGVRSPSPVTRSNAATSAGTVIEGRGARAQVRLNVHIYSCM